MANIHITSIADLLSFAAGEKGTGTSAEYINVYLDKDLDFTLDNSGAYVNTDFAGCTGITSYCNFYGQNHTIKNIHYNGSADWGFFPSAYCINVYDLTLKDISIVTTASAGGIICTWSLSNDIIKQCHVSGSITSTGSTVGGIVGREPTNGGSGHSIQYCTFSGILKGDIVGGILGFKHKGSGYNWCNTYMQNCGVRADIVGTTVGGISINNGDSLRGALHLSRCYFIGNLSGSSVYAAANWIQGSASEVYVVVKDVSEGITLNIADANIIYDNDVATTAGYTVTGGTPETSAHLKDATYMRTTYNWSA